MARRVPGWVTTTGWILLGLAAATLPVALVVATLDAVRRSGPAWLQGLVLGLLVLLAVVLVVGLERGLVYAAREWELRWVAASAGGVALVVLAGVLVAPLGLVLTALGVVVATPLAAASLGVLAWWRWRYGPRPEPRARPTTEEVRARAEERRAIVRARHDATREAVARGLIGPGFTRGR